MVQLGIITYVWCRPKREVSRCGPSDALSLSLCASLSPLHTHGLARPSLSRPASPREGGDWGEGRGGGSEGGRGEEGRRVEVGGEGCRSARRCPRLGVPARLLLGRGSRGGEGRGRAMGRGRPSHLRDVAYPWPIPRRPPARPPIPRTAQPAVSPDTALYSVSAPYTLLHPCTAQAFWSLTHLAGPGDSPVT